jgi:hypothetical protein
MKLKHTYLSTAAVLGRKIRGTECASDKSLGNYLLRFLGCQCLFLCRVLVEQATPPGGLGLCGSVLLSLVHFDVSPTSIQAPPMMQTYQRKKASRFSARIRDALFKQPSPPNPIIQALPEPKPPF